MAAIGLPRRVSQEGRAPGDCLAVVVDDVMTAGECASLVETYGAAESLRKVTEAAGDGFKVAIQQPRNYSLGVFKDDVLRRGLWRRLEGRAGAALDAFRLARGEARPLGLNERLRVLRYEAGERFEPHYDLVVDDGASRSLVTVLLYLTEDFEGGDTVFLDAAEPASCPAAVRPKVGRCVLFEHALFHTGAEVSRGRKFVLRTDVMFESRAALAPPALPSPPPPPPPAPSVVALLRNLGLGEWCDAVDGIGLGGSLEAFLAAGPCAAAMLAELEIPASDVSKLVAAAQAAAPPIR